MPVPKLLAGSPYAARNRPLKISEITPEQVEMFLLSLAETGLMGLSANRAGLSVDIIRRIKLKDQKFAALIIECQTVYADGAIKELQRRAVDGWDEPVFSHKTGMQVGTIRKYSDKLMELLAKAVDPRFRDKFEGEIKVTGGVLVVPASPGNALDFVARAQAKMVAATIIEPEAPPQAQLPAPETKS